MKRASLILSSLYCLSALHADNYTVSSATEAELRAGILAVSNGGGTMTFNVLSGSVIPLTSPLPQLAGATGPVVINTATGPYVTIDGANTFPGFYVGPNIEASISNLNFRNMASVGGSGGHASLLIGTNYSGGGGGGGLGAGAALFVEKGASVAMENVSCYDSRSEGGAGGVGSAYVAFRAPPPAYGDIIGGGGGGGGAFYGAFAAGGVGQAIPSFIVLNPLADSYAIGAGGGGGGSGAGLAGTQFLGGMGGGSLGGAGGDVLSNGSNGGLFSGGGGGGGTGSNLFFDVGAGVYGGAGGDGGEFGGGGGAAGAVISSLSNIGLAEDGGIGEFGAGGGGGGVVFFPSAASKIFISEGGGGGFGGGGGGASGTSVYGGGRGGATAGDLLSSGGGGGAAMGGAIFVRDGAFLTVRYSTPGLTGLTGNTVIGGTAGSVNATPGGMYGQDLFFNAGGDVSFVIDTPITIATNLDSDPAVFAQDRPLQVQGSAPLTLLGDNTFSGGVNVISGQLQVARDANLGLTTRTPGTLILSEGVLSIQGTTFATERPVRLGLPGATLSTALGSTALFAGMINDLNFGDFASLSIQGKGVVQLGATNTYGQETIVGPSATLQLLSDSALPVAPTRLEGGALEFTSPLKGEIASSISGTGTLRALAGSFPDLSGANTAVGNLFIDAGATLGVAQDQSFPEEMSITNDGILYVHHSFGTIAAPGMIGVGDVVQAGNGTLQLSTDNTYSGNTILRKGIAEISGGSALGSSSLVFEGGSLQLTSSFVSPLGATAVVGTSGGNVIIDSPTVATASGNWNLLGPVNVRGGGSLALDGAWTGSGIITVGSDTTLILSSAGALIPAQTISGSGSVSVFAPDETFSGLKNYGGTTTIAPGVTLTVDAPNAIPGNSNIVNDGQLIFDFASPSFSKTLQGSISGSGTLTLREGIVTLNGMNTYGGITDIYTEGVLQAGTASGIPPGGAVIVKGKLVFQNTAGTAMPGPISGIGSVSMDGTGGSLSLTAGNLYQGGTFFNSGFVQVDKPAALGGGGYLFNGGTLELLPAFSGPLTKGATIGSAGGAVQLDGVNTDYSGALVGSGSFSCTGSGRLTLLAQNTYSGDTLIGPNATLQLDQVDRLNPLSTVMDEGELRLSISSGTASFPNEIQGAGYVTLTGAASFELQKTSNSYGGGTILSTGQLILSSFSQIGSGLVSLLGDSTLKFEPGSYTTDRPFFLGVGGGNFQLESGSDVTLSGGIGSDLAAPLTIKGPGQLTLSGLSTTTGVVTIEEGAQVTAQGVSFSGPVTVASDSLLSGSGSVGGALSNSGTITMSVSDSFSVTDNYEQASGSRLEMQISGSSGNSQIVVGKQAVLDGSLVVDAKPGVYIAGTFYTLISANEPLITTFADVQLPPFPELVLIYDQDPAVILAVFSQSVLQGSSVKGHNPNQVLDNLRAIIHTPSTDLVTSIEAMVNLSSDELALALDQLHPAQFSAFDLVNANVSSHLTSIFARHPAETCCLNLRAPCSLTDASLWLQPFGSLYNQDRKGEQVGFDSQTLGLAAGINFSQTSGLLIGTGAAFSSSKIDWDEERGDGVMDKMSFAIYGDYTHRNFFFAASVLGSLDRFHGTRHIRYADIDRKARHDEGGYDFTAHLGLGSDFRLGAFSVSPFANADYFYLYQKPYSESGASSLNQEVAGKRSNMLRSELGLSFTRSYQMQNRGCFSPTLFASGIYETFLKTRSLESTFQNESPSYTVRTWNKPLLLLSPGFELSFLWDIGLSAAIRYTGEFGNTVNRQKLDTRLEWFF